MARSTTPKGNHRRDEIIAKATQLIIKRGIDAFTFELLAKAMKASPPHLRYYFASKRDLFLACFEKVAGRGQAETLAMLENAHDWRARLYAIIDATFSWCKKHPSDFAITFVFYHYASIDSKLARAQEQIREHGRQRIEAILWAGLSPFVSKDEVFEYSIQIQALLTGLVVELATTPQTYLQRNHKTALRFVDQILEQATRRMT